MGGIVAPSERVDAALLPVHRRCKTGNLAALPDRRNSEYVDVEGLQNLLGHASQKCLGDA